jgi:predicted transposase/invertase (TIGR01784 family)
VIAIHQLPRTIDTLFLRLLGRGKVQADAIDELRALSLDHPYRSTTLHHISRLQVNLKLRQNKSKELREIIMNLAPAYDAWLEEVEAKAIAKGGTEVQITIARRMLEINLPIETIAQVTGLSIEFLQQLRSTDSSS